MPRSLPYAKEEEKERGRERERERERQRKRNRNTDRQGRKTDWGERETKTDTNLKALWQLPMQYNDCFNQFKLLFCYPDMTCKMGSEIEAREILGLGYGDKNLVL